MPAHPLAAAVLISWNRNGAYARRLVEGLTPDQFLAQPVPGRTLNHPAWILSHLNLYAPLAAAMLRRRPFDDPATHPFGPTSAPLPDPAAYLPPADLVAQYRALHDDARLALESADHAVFAEPTPLPRWRGLHPTVGDMIVTLMVKHESGHLGQLSAWRRALGLPPVAV
jgi:hypothetical protein